MDEATYRAPSSRKRPQTAVQAEPIPPTAQESALHLTGQIWSAGKRQRKPPAVPVTPISSDTKVHEYATEVSIGEHWGEFPLPERQKELRHQLEMWDRERKHGEHLGPFAKQTLTGSDVFWLAVWVAGEGDSAVGRQILLERGRYSLSFPHLNLAHANLQGAHLNQAYLQEAQLEGANLQEAQLEGAKLLLANLHEADLSHANLKNASLSAINGTGADFYGARLENASFFGAVLTDARFYHANLEGSDLEETFLEGTKFDEAQLGRVDLRGASLDAQTSLVDVQLDCHVRIADVLWNTVPLSRLHWNQVQRLGDEEIARQPEEIVRSRAKKEQRYKKSTSSRIEEYQAAIRANRQLAVALRSQGINEVADRFAFRAQVLRRELLWLESGLPTLRVKRFLHLLQHRLHTCFRLVRLSMHRPVPQQTKWTLFGVWHRWQQRRRLQPRLAEGQGSRRPWFRRVRLRKLGAWCWSLLLSILAGYGYKPGRSLLAYLAVIFGFTGLYLLNSHLVTPHLTWDQALVLSVSCFHGRGFFEQDITLGSTYARLAACEAVIGLLIEISFISTFTQRFLSR